MRRIVDLEFVARVGDEDDQQLRRLNPTRIFRRHVVGSWLLDPVLALAVSAHWLVIEFAAHSAVEHVGINEGITVPMRQGSCIGREVYDR